jgi:hypothetical protein
VCSSPRPSRALRRRPAAAAQPLSTALALSTWVSTGSRTPKQCSTSVCLSAFMRPCMMPKVTISSGLARQPMCCTLKSYTTAGGVTSTSSFEWPVLRADTLSENWSSGAYLRISSRLALVGVAPMLSSSLVAYSW